MPVDCYLLCSLRLLVGLMLPFVTFDLPCQCFGIMSPPELCRAPAERMPSGGNHWYSADRSSLPYEQHGDHGEAASLKEALECHLEALHFKGDNSTACRPSAILFEDVLGRRCRKVAAHNPYCDSFLALAYVLEHLPMATAYLHRSNLQEMPSFFSADSKCHYPAASNASSQGGVEDVKLCRTCSIT